MIYSYFQLAALQNAFKTQAFYEKGVFIALFQAATLQPGIVGQWVIPAMLSHQAKGDGQSLLNMNGPSANSQITFFSI